VCATNRNPLQDVQEGRFREDLYYRLNVIPINLPPLSERDSDVILIARYFLKKFVAEENKEFKQFSHEVEKIFLDYTWPGNVRQLQNVIRNIVVLHKGTEINKAMLPEDITHNVNTKMNVEGSEITEEYSKINETESSLLDIKPFWIIEKEAFTKAIAACNGNILKAAEILDVSPSMIYRKIQLWTGEEKNRLRLYTAVLTLNRYYYFLNIS
jgi:two-component system repressor protein LuxO